MNEIIAITHTVSKSYQVKVAHDYLPLPCIIKGESSA